MDYIFNLVEKSNSSEVRFSMAKQESKSEAAFVELIRWQPTKIDPPYSHILISAIVSTVLVPVIQWSIICSSFSSELHRGLFSTAPEIEFRSPSLPLDHYSCGLKSRSRYVNICYKTIIFFPIGVFRRYKCLHIYTLRLLFIMPALATDNFKYVIFNSYPVICAEINIWRAHHQLFYFIS